VSDHTPSADFRQFNHLPISITRNFAIITIDGRGGLIRLISSGRAGQEARQRVTTASGEAAHRVTEHLVAKGGPLERMPDALGDVVPGPPAQQVLGSADAGEGARDVTGPPGPSCASTGCPATRLNAARSSRTVVPVPVPRLMTVTGRGRASNRVSAATCAAAAAAAVPSASRDRRRSG
jgi:hypothetical protein